MNRTGYMSGHRSQASAAAAAGGAVPGAPAAGPAARRAAAPAARDQDGSGGPELEMVVTATTLHVKNFLECVKSRQKPVSDAEVGFYATLPCVLAIRAMREGKAIGWDSPR